MSIAEKTDKKGKMQFDISLSNPKKTLEVSDSSNTSFTRPETTQHESNPNSNSKSLFQKSNSKLITPNIKRRNEAYLFFKNFLDKSKQKPEKKNDIINDYALAYKYNNHNCEVFKKTFSEFLSGSTTIQDVMDAKNFPKNYPQIKSKREQRKKMLNLKDISTLIMTNKSGSPERLGSPLRKQGFSPRKSNVGRSTTLLLKQKVEENVQPKPDHFSIIRNKINARVQRKKEIIEELEQTTDKYQYSFNDPKFMMHFYAYQNELLDGMKKKYSENYVERYQNNMCQQKNKNLKSLQIRKEYVENEELAGNFLIK